MYMLVWGFLRGKIYAMNRINILCELTAHDFKSVPCLPPLCHCYASSSSSRTKRVKLHNFLAPPLQSCLVESFFGSS